MFDTEHSYHLQVTPQNGHQSGIVCIMHSLARSGFYHQQRLVQPKMLLAIRLPTRPADQLAALAYLLNMCQQGTSRKACLQIQVGSLVLHNICCRQTLQD